MVVNTPTFAVTGKAVALACPVQSPILKVMSALAANRANTARPPEFQSFGAGAGRDIVPLHQSQQRHTSSVAKLLSNHWQIELSIPVQEAQFLCGWWLDAARRISTILVGHNLAKFLHFVSTAKTNLFGKGRQSSSAFYNDCANVFVSMFPLIPGDAVGDVKQGQTASSLLHNGFISVGALDVLMRGSVDHAAISVEKSLKPTSSKIFLHTYSLPCLYSVSQGAI